jgi:hypothetical protein
VESVQEPTDSPGLVIDSADVERVVLIASLKPGAREQVLELLERSAASGEQDSVAQRQGVRSTMFSPWRPLFERPLHLAREAYFFERGGDE